MKSGLKYCSLFLLLLACKVSEPPASAPRIAEDELFLENLMKTRPDYFQEILQRKDEYQIQIIYTQINRDENNVPSFKSFEFNVNDDYFYPASTVKLPTALMALEKLNELNIPELNKWTTMLTDSAYSGQSAVYKDPTSATGLPSVAHYIKKIFLVSDNDAYNRLYEFIGQEEINRKLQERGFTDSRIIGRLAIRRSEDENRHTNPVKFISGDSVIYQQPMKFHEAPLNLKGEVLKGKGHIANGELVNEPMDFTKKNYLALDEAQMMLRAVMFPESVPREMAFNLTGEDYQFVYQYLSQLPSETTFPAYDTAEYHDGYSKLLLYGDEKAPLPKHIRSFSKYGQSYGYLIDHAYVMDPKNKVEFLLSAVIQTNANQIYNDNVYEYDEIGFPFLKNLGQLIYDYELKRDRAYIPDLSRFIVSYDRVVKVANKIAPNLYQNYDHYHIPDLNFRRIRRSDIEPYVEECAKLPGFEVEKPGESVLGKDINLIKVGSGPKKVLLWSQMHGDESTATRALFEIFRFLSANDTLNSFREEILKGATLYVIPMLNPDGAEDFKRRNALSIDVNRDALRLISPEGQLLKAVQQKYQPEFGFNLHDQSKYYNAYRTGKTASISFLAPAFDYEKTVNEGRGNAMKLIVSMNDVIQEYMPGHIARYNDDFEPRAFGDNIQKWGTNTILIESGGYPNDPEKKELVKMNFVAILHALSEIVGETYKEKPLNAYYQIPENDRKFFDVLIREVTIQIHGTKYLMDIGILRHENLVNGEIRYTSSIDDMGDLSTFYGYEEIKGEGLEITAGKILPDPVFQLNEITEEKAINWLKQGYTAIRVENISDNKGESTLPIHLVPVGTETLESPQPGSSAPLLLWKDGEVAHAIIHGKVITF